MALSRMHILEQDKLANDLPCLTIPPWSTFPTKLMSALLS